MEVVPVNKKPKFQVPLALVALNRRRLTEELWRISVHPSSIVLLQGGKIEYRGCSDFEPVFRQIPSHLRAFILNENKESYFHWAFGVKESDFYGAIRVATGNSILFFPRPSSSDIIFAGLETDPEVIKALYGVDEVYFVDEMRAKLEELKPHQLLLLGAPCAEASFGGIENFQLDRTNLLPAMSKLRAYKTELELDVMRHVNQISSDGHIKVLQTIRPGMTEYQIESVFLNYCYFEGNCRNVAYTTICGSGENAAILHYSRNDRTIQDGDLVLCDMGAEYYCYAADITMTFPANGKFTEDQIKIYNSVLAANLAVLDASGPGVPWASMQLLSERVILQKLTEYGLLQGNLDEMLQARLQRTFFPHGLGHLLGLDVHDVGDQYSTQSDLPEISSDEPIMYDLKTRRNKSMNKMPSVLRPGMVFTIEPGCYFIDFLLDQALDNPSLSRFLVSDEIKRFRGFGGVRIEDNAIVTNSGIEVITSVPKTVEEIEAVMANSRTYRRTKEN